MEPIPTKQWAIELHGDIDPKVIAAKHGHEYLGPIANLPVAITEPGMF